MIRSWTVAGLPILAALLLLIVGPAFAPARRAPIFLLLMVLMAGELALIGWLINGRPAGAFIDRRNRLSLSKLQAAAWTVVVLAGFGTAATYNIATAVHQDAAVTALAIAIPGDLLIAMGISATSMVATPALLTMKSQEQASDPVDTLRAARATMGPAIDHVGKLLVRAAPGDASWSDLVTGEEIGNAGSVDLGKIQQAAITLLLLGCYVAYVYADLAGSQETVRALPALDQSFVWLLGISHASYLAYKAAPHTT